jgi:isopentenyl phosphate kinase
MAAAMSDLVLVKLGGSVITDKNRPFVALEDVVRRLGREIIQAASDAPGLHLIIGHGSGSFGHQVAHEYRTHEGIVNAESWHGFAETARAAARLNRLVTDWLFEEGLPVVSFQPSATARCRDRQLVRLDTEPLQRALRAGLIPIVYGDVALDEQQGFTIISTEQIFDYLATRLPATRIVLAGIVDGVFDADPVRYPLAARFERITPRSWPHVRTALGGSHAIDVTGGMLSKVHAMVDLVTARPELSVTIASGAIPGRLREVLSGHATTGTTICADTDS